MNDTVVHWQNLLPKLDVPHQTAVLELFRLERLVSLPNDHVMVRLLCDLIQELRYAVDTNGGKSLHGALSSVGGSKDILDETQGLLSAVGRTDTSLEGFRDAAPGTRGSLAYEALVWVFREKPKANSHTHLSVAGHEDEVAHVVLNSPGKERAYAELIEKAREDGELDLAEELSQMPDDQGELARMLRKCSVGTFERYDFFVQSLSDLRAAARLAARRQLDDGVTRFDLRLNPVKWDLDPSSGRREWTPDRVRGLVRDCLGAAWRGIREAREEPGAKDECTGGILLSFSRGKKHRNGFCVQELANLAMEAVGQQEELRERVAGLDISGPEFCPNEHDIPKWREAVRRADAMGLDVVCHLGDHTFPGGRLKQLNHDAKQAYLAKNGEAFSTAFTEATCAHLDFVDRFVEMMPTGSRIAHGLILQPSVLLMPLRSCECCQAETPQVLELERELQPEHWCRIDDLSARIRERIAGKKMAVEICPTATVRSGGVTQFRALPVRNWLTQDVKVGLGTDATWIRDRAGITLSEEIVRLLLSCGDLRIVDVLDMVDPHTPRVSGHPGRRGPAG